VTFNDTEPVPNMSWKFHQALCDTSNVYEGYRIQANNYWKISKRFYVIILTPNKDMEFPCDYYKVRAPAPLVAVDLFCWDIFGIRCTQFPIEIKLFDCTAINVLAYQFILLLLVLDYRVLYVISRFFPIHQIADLVHTQNCGVQHLRIALQHSIVQFSSFRGR
jgi:hypothetical protein